MKHTSVHAKPINNIAPLNAATTLVVARLTGACDPVTMRFVGRVVKATINKRRFCIVQTIRGGGELVYAGKLQHYVRDKKTGKITDLIFNDEILTF